MANKKPRLPPSMGRPAESAVPPGGSNGVTSRPAAAKPKKGSREYSAGTARDLVFTGAVKRAKAHFGATRVFIGGERLALPICIACPSLAFEYVIAMDGFPLGIVMQLVAFPGVGKSGFVAEFGRWFHMANGGLHLTENETKHSPPWFRSIMGDEAFSRMQGGISESLEQSQEMVTFGMKDNKAAMKGTKKEPGPGRIVPVLYAIDSIMGKQSEETQEKILGKKGSTGERGTTGTGHATRGHPLEAQVITRFMRVVGSEMDEWPFSLLLVNHLRHKTDDMGNMTRHKTGGVQIDFQESVELELKRVGGPKRMIKCGEFEGYGISMSCEKNSLGPTNRSVQTRIIWWYEDDEQGGQVQRTVWDWDWSTVWLLDNLLHGEKADPMIRQSLKQQEIHLECPARGDIENSAWSKNLGMKATDAVPWSQLGALIREDKELMVKLRKAMFIRKQPKLSGDYFAQINQLMKGMV